MEDKAYSVRYCICVQVLEACRWTKFVDDGIKATRLFPKRWSCETINMMELGKLEQPSYIYECHDYAREAKYIGAMEKNSRFPSSIELRFGAQVWFPLA